MVFFNGNVHIFPCVSSLGAKRLLGCITRIDLYTHFNIIGSIYGKRNTCSRLSEFCNNFDWLSLGLRSTKITRGIKPKSRYNI